MNDADRAVALAQLSRVSVAVMFEVKREICAELGRRVEIVILVSDISLQSVGVSSSIVDKQLLRLTILDCLARVDEAIAVDGQPKPPESSQ